MSAQPDLTVKLSNLDEALRRLLAAVKPFHFLTGRSSRQELPPSRGCNDVSECSLERFAAASSMPDSGPRCCLASAGAALTRRRSR